MSCLLITAKKALLGDSLEEVFDYAILIEYGKIKEVAPIEALKGKYPNVDLLIIRTPVSCQG